MKALMRPVTLVIAGLLLSGYGALLLSSGLSLSTAIDHFYLFFVGIFAATIANSTGMGGGVVFLPAFEFISDYKMSLSAAQIIGMSFVIQCFGMTMGSCRWLFKAYGSAPKDNASPDTGIKEQDFWRLIGWVLIFAIPALLITQYGLEKDKDLILFIFKAFSIALGLKLLIATWLTPHDAPRKRTLDQADYRFLAAAGVLGGVATALFSVGVGEFVALYLFIRNFPLVTCAATAVILSALTVIIGLPWHVIHTPLPWDLLAIVIPGALLGGFLARSFALWLGNRRLKYMAAVWIIGSSLFLLLH